MLNEAKASVLKRVMITAEKTVRLTNETSTSWRYLDIIAGVWSFPSSTRPEQMSTKTKVCVAEVENIPSG